MKQTMLSSVFVLLALVFGFVMIINPGKRTPAVASAATRPRRPAIAPRSDISSVSIVKVETFWRDDRHFQEITYRNLSDKPIAFLHAALADPYYINSATQAINFFSRKSSPLAPGAESKTIALAEAPFIIALVIYSDLSFDGSEKLASNDVPFFKGWIAAAQRYRALVSDMKRKGKNAESITTEVLATLDADHEEAKKQKPDFGFGTGGFEFRQEVRETFRKNGVNSKQGVIDHFDSVTSQVRIVRLPPSAPLQTSR